jgi:signal transduction histidine kinase
VSASELITATAQVILAAILIPVLVRAVQDRTRGAIDIALFFGLLDALLLRAVLGLADIPVIGIVTAAFAFALPYLMLRLLADFSRVPALLVRAAEVTFALLVISAVAYPSSTLPPLVTAFRTLYFVLLFIYTGAGFVQLARHSTGVTRRRMQAVSAGNVLFALVIAVAGVLTISPALAAPGTVVIGPGILATSIAWFLGFATPAPLRRFWQEPELRAFFARTAAVARLTDAEAATREIVDATAAATGARAALGLWDEEAQLMRFRDAGGRAYSFAPGHFLAWTAFAERRAVYTEHASRADPENAPAYRAGSIDAVLSAPVSAGDRVLGVLIVYAPNALVFPRGDLELVRLIADQAAVVLEGRRLIAEASRMQAREDAARLKEDFISAAAHDLKTPLTALFGRAQLLQRRLQQGAALDPAVGDRIVADVKRLAALADRLLDASRIGQGRLEIHREPADLGDLVRELHAGRADWARVQLRTDGRLPGSFDRALIEQVIDNLVGNALKYSEADRPVTVSVTRDDGLAHLAVHDDGIGIPPAELEMVFERFRRGSNATERHFGGIGLGLFICRGIVEGHGGRVWAESEASRGTTLHVTLPLADDAHAWEVAPSSSTRDVTP